MTSKIVTTVWSGEKSVKVKGKVIVGPRISVVDDSVNQWLIPNEQKTRTFETVKVFRSDKPVRSRSRDTYYFVRWWLYYAPDRMTGGFATKREAIAWRRNGGK